MSFDVKIHINWRKSGASGNNLGGDIHVDEIPNRTLHNLFPNFTENEVISGITKYRCIYMINLHPSINFLNPIFYIPINTLSPSTQIWVGLDPSGVQDQLDTGLTQTIVNENTAPTGVQFTQATNRAEGIPLRMHLPANGKVIPVWFRLKLNAGAEIREADYTKIAIDCDNKFNDTGFPALPIDTTVGVVGETDQNQNSSDVIDRLKLRNLDWLIFNGDITTQYSPSWLINKLGFLKDFTLFGWGQEDVKDISIRNQITNAFSVGTSKVGNGYHYKDINNLHFLFIDTSEFQSYENPSTQYDFIVQDLENASRDNDIDFIIVVMNDIMYGALPTNETLDHNDILRQTYHKLFQDYGVHVVLQSKLRNYQFLGNLRYNEGNLDQPSTLFTAPNYTITSGQKSFGSDAGVLFCNIGTGGRNPFHTLGSTSNYSQFFGSVPTYGGSFVLKAQMKTESKKAKLTGLYYDYVLSNSFFNLFGATRQEKLIHQWSITLDPPTA